MKLQFKKTSEQKASTQEPEKTTCPFLRFGSGPETLVIFPTINDSIFDLEDTGRYFRFLFRSLTRHFTFYIIGRRRNLPIGYTTLDMAHDYAETFSQLSLGPVHLIGISLGGLVAQYFAAKHPQHVKRLVLIANAHHMGPEGLQIARRWIPWARLGLWNKITEETLEISFRGIRLHVLRMLTPLLIRYYLRHLKSPADFITSGQAAILHDASDILASLEMPVLIIGGTRDRFFADTLYQEMQKKIRTCESLIIRGARHGVLEQCKSQCLHRIFMFLNQRKE